MVPHPKEPEPKALGHKIKSLTVAACCCCSAFCCRCFGSWSGGGNHRSHGSIVSWFPDDGGAEHGGEAEEPAEAGEDPAVEPSVHRAGQPAGAAAHAGRTRTVPSANMEGRTAASHQEARSRVYLCLQELAERYAPLLRLQVSEVGGALESIRLQAVKRGKGNKTFKETNVATLELLLPRDRKKVSEGSASSVCDGNMETRNDVTSSFPGSEDKEPPGDQAGRAGSGAGGQVRRQTGGQADGFQPLTCVDVVFVGSERSSASNTSN